MSPNSRRSSTSASVLMINSQGLRPPERYPLIIKRNPLDFVAV